ncbi:ornithine cyclodeaminase family protein [Afifella aestuarii]|uniref:ornithine cyclodeaminase family protein n=1 Tax=Afifella aestuarii TaxID=1909496 RepID=UPI000FE2A8EF|nr:ornithine cyclodeaminase family protein [Afifella aestuarii]
MRVIPAADIADVLTFPELIETLRSAFRQGVVTPVRHHHSIQFPDQAEATLLLMPSWNDFDQQGHSERGYVGVKIVTVFPDNASRGKAAVAGVYLLFSGKSGEPLAVIDGSALTVWRTAAASALAASYLARPDAKRLLMVGAGALAPYLIEAHAAVRPIEEVLIWNRRPEKAERLAERLRPRRYRPHFTEDLEGAVRGADIVSCATLSNHPIVKGEWLKPGAHLDLVGGFRPEMRETDDDAIRRARVFVDTREGAMKEAGDIAQPLESGILTADDITADLFELTRGEKAGRRFYDQITLFKSVGTALEDLAAAILVFSRA